MSEYNFPYFEEETGKVNCQICGKPFLVISPKHLSSHNIKYSEYKLRFPDAPLSCEEFGIVSKYGKEKDMFSEDEEVVIEETFLEEEPEVEEIVIDTVLINSNTGKLDKIKGQVFDCLRSFFSNVKSNYIIREKLIDGTLELEFITDFADPVLKVDIEFPNTFWHNIPQYDDPNRDKKLEAKGWKIITIKGKSPKYKDIQKAIENS
jgi:hypothetical protein